jgi:diacylglycerol kinase
MSNYRNRSFPQRLGFALRGLAHALRTQRSLKVQAAFLLVVLAVLIVWRPRPAWWALTLLASSTVLAAELLNTAIEQLADELHPQESRGIGLVKDCAAAAVLLAVLGALAVGVALLLHLLERH